MQREQVETALRAMGVEPTGFNGEWVQARCPFAQERHPRHRDSRPSFGVSVSSPSVYYCFTCHSKGVLSSLPGDLAHLTGDRREELAHELMIAEATGAVVTPESYDVFEPLKPLPEAVFGPDLFVDIDGDGAAYEYLISRSVTLECARRLGLRAWPEDKRIMFPVRGFNGDLFGWTGRAYDDTVKPKVWNTDGLDKKCHLLGAEHAACDRPMVLVEGLFAYARFHEMGIPETMGVDVCAVMGSTVSEEQADMLAEIGQRVILFLDGDKAGQLGTFGDAKREGAVHMLARAMPVSTVTYPRGIIDPDDLDEATVCHMIEGATPFVRSRTRARA